MIGNERKLQACAFTRWAVARAAMYGRSNKATGGGLA